MQITRQLLFSDEARKKLSVGCDKLARAVVSTLGPRSKNVAIEQVGKLQTPHVVHDGVTVAANVFLADPFENMGASLLRDAAVRTNDIAGDGTTTATLLANTLIQEGMKLTGSGMVDGVIAGRVNAMELRERLIDESIKIESQLTEIAKKYKNKADAKVIAKISSGHDDIAEGVDEAVKKVGEDGAIMVEEGGGQAVSVSVREGYEMTNGYLSPYFITDPDRMLVEYEDGYVLITDMMVSDAMQLVPIVEKVMQNGNKPLLIIAGDVVGAALEALVKTKLNLKAGLVAVMAPDFGERRKDSLDDLALMTGGKVVSADTGDKLTDVQLFDLGRFERISISPTHSVIVPKNPDRDEVEDRVQAIRKMAEDVKDNAFRRDRLIDRANRLSGKVAVLSIGGLSEAEIKERKERAIDAVHAVKAALEEGVIPGGGTVLHKIGMETYSNSGDPVYVLINRALTAPMRTLIENSGLDFATVTKLISALPKSITDGGYDIVGKRAGSMTNMSIFDPVKVTRLAVRHAFSCAAMILTTDTVIAFEPAKDVQKFELIK